MSDTDLPQHGSPPTPRLWRRSWFRLAVLLLALGLIAFVSLHTYLTRRAERELRETIEALDRKEPNGWRLADLEAQRAAVPEERNSALVVLEARKRMPSPWPTPGGWRLVSQIGNLPPGHLLNDALAEELRRELERTFAALAEARRLADMPAGRYPSNPSSSRLEVLSVARMLGMEAVLAAHDGHPDHALRADRSALNVGRSIGDEPNVASQLVRIACQKAAADSVQRTLSLGEPSDAELKAAQRLFEEEAQQPLLVVAYRAERAYHNWLMEGLATGELDLNQVGGNARLGGVGLPAPAKQMSLAMLGGWSPSAHARILRLMTDMVEASRSPASEQRVRVLEACGAVQQATQDDFILSQLLYPVTGVVNDFLGNQALLRCSMAALAAERYRQAHQRWPASLSELVPAEFLSAVPVDPLDGAPLRLLEGAGGLLIYSVGYDGKDDGGKLDSSGVYMPGYDLGFRLWDVTNRRQPPPEPGSRSPKR